MESKTARSDITVPELEHLMDEVHCYRCAGRG